MDITPIPDREAATMLGVKYQTIRNAVKRGDLTRIPVTGQLQHVAREQVILFQGMKFVKKDFLSEDYRKTWMQIKRNIEARNEREVPQGTPFSVRSLIQRLQPLLQDTPEHRACS
jgi:hypothetical protein